MEGSRNTRNYKTNWLIPLGANDLIVSEVFSINS
jgi:hypothetical protein